MARTSVLPENAGPFEILIGYLRKVRKIMSIELVK